jgi:site-specific recombinase XerD
VAAQIVPLPAVTLGRAAREFLARRDLDADTIRSYRQTLTRLCRELGDDIALTQLTAEQAAELFETAWGGAAARTWNRHRSTLRSFTTWASAPARGYLHTDLAGLIDRRPEIQDRTRAIDRHDVEALWERRDVAVREKALWRLLYESAARADSVLALNIEHLDQANKRGKITAKGGSIIWIHWQSGTARLLPRLIAGRTQGPLFLAERRPAPARTPAAVDLCPDTGRGRLSYERAEYLFKQATGGWTLHQLRHSRLTHLGEDGWSAPMLQALSNHASLRSLGIYTHPSHEAVAAALAQHDPGRRRR